MAQNLIKHWFASETVRPKPNDCYVAYDISECIFFNWSFCFAIWSTSIVNVLKRDFYTWHRPWLTVEDVGYVKCPYVYIYLLCKICNICRISVGLVIDLRWSSRHFPVTGMHKQLTDAFRRLSIIIILLKNKQLSGDILSCLTDRKCYYYGKYVCIPQLCNITLISTSNSRKI